MRMYSNGFCEQKPLLLNKMLQNLNISTSIRISSRHLKKAKLAAVYGVRLLHTALQMSEYILLYG